MAYKFALALGILDIGSDHGFHVHNHGAAYHGVTFHQQLALAKLHGAAVAVGYGFALPTQGAQLGLELVSGGIGGQATDIEITAREIKKLKLELYEITASHTGKTIDEIALHSDRDYWLTAIEAKEFGLVDEVLFTNPRKAAALKG